MLLKKSVGGLIDYQGALYITHISKGMSAAPIPPPAERPRPLVYVIGATGAGKSACAVEVALAAKKALSVGVHIINADAMQLLQGLPVGTNKPTTANDTKGIPHHLIGTWPSSSTTAPPKTVHDFVADASAVITRLRREDPGCLILVCGGTNYYIQALLLENSLSPCDEGDATTTVAAATPPSSGAAFVGVQQASPLLLDAPSEEGRERKRPRSENVPRGGQPDVGTGIQKHDAAQEQRKGDASHPPLPTTEGSATAAVDVEGAPTTTTVPCPSRWEQLNAVDPVMAQRWHPNDERRIATSLAVYRRTGRLPSACVAEQPAAVLRHFAAAGDFEAAPIVLWVDYDDRETLFDRINRRVTAMAQRGIVAEAAAHFDATSSSAPNGGSEEGAAMSLTSGIESAIGYKEFYPALCSIRRERTCRSSGGTSAASASASPVDVDDARIVEALETLRAHTRQYAKQQQQWIQNRFCRRYSALLYPRFFRVEGATAGAAAVAAPDVVLQLLRDDSCDPQLPLGVTRVPVSAALLVGRGNSPSTSGDGGGRGSELASASTQRCEMCDKTLCGALQWEAHVASRAHRNGLRRIERQKESGVSWPRRQGGADQKGKGKAHYLASLQ